MINRRSLILRAVGTAAAAGLGATPSILMHRKSKAKAVETDVHYRVTCQEISDAVWLSEYKVWSKTLREISWSTEDIDLMPDVGDVIQIERTAGVSPEKKLGTLGSVGLKVEKFKARVISVIEIR